MPQPGRRARQRPARHRRGPVVPPRARRTPGEAAGPWSARAEDERVGGPSFPGGGGPSGEGRPVQLPALAHWRVGLSAGRSCASPESCGRACGRVACLPSFAIFTVTNLNRAHSDS